MTAGFLRHSRALTAAAALTLALAMGASVAIFSLVDALLLRSLPVAEPSQLVTVSSEFAIKHGFLSGAGWNDAMWESLRRRAAPFGGALAWHTRAMTIGRGADTQIGSGMYVSGEFFDALGIRPYRGRLIASGDDRAGGGDAGLVAVISHRLWQRRFGGAAAAIGSEIVVDGTPVRLVGVTPPSFLGLEAGQAFDVALPISAEPAVRGRGASLLRPNSFLLLVMLRLKPAQSVDAATAAIRQMQAEITPADAPEFAREPFALVPASGGASNPLSAQQIYRRPLVTMLAAVAPVLLIACVNVANLLLARAAGKRRDVAMRVALGASRWQIARPFLVESFLLAASGTVLGLVLGRGAAAGIASMASVTLDLAVDWRVAGFAVAVTCVVTALAGAGPAIRAARIPPMAALRVESGGLAGSRTGLLAQALVAGQVALALVVLVAAGLLFGTFSTLSSRPLGFDPRGVLVVTVDTGRVEANPAERLALYDRITKKMTEVPGIEHSGASLWTPLSGGGVVIGVKEPGDPKNERPVVANFITPGWLSTYGTPLKLGRDFNSADSADAMPVVIVNEAYARRYFPGAQPVGQLTLNKQTIVGVAGDAMFRSVQRIPSAASIALREPIPPTVYVPLAQAGHWDRPPSASIRVSVKSPAGLSITPAIGAALSAVDPRLGMTVKPVADDVRAAVAGERMLASVAGAFAMLALVLAVIGLYGVLSHSVSRRQHEMGLRMALGADRRRVLQLVIGRALIVVAIGTAIGLIASAQLTRLMSSLLFGVAPLDIPTFAAVSALLIAAAIGAALVPAIRATRVDPAIALRSV